MLKACIGVFKTHFMNKTPSDEAQFLPPPGPLPSAPPGGSIVGRWMMLLAEDSDDDAYFFQRELRKSNLSCTMVRAANGKLAIEALQAALAGGVDQVFPSLVFLDLKMPVMSGFEVLEWLNTTDARDRLQVIVLSGSNDGTDRQRAADLGACDYLVKPITAAHLKSSFEQFVANRPQGLRIGGAL